MAVGDAHVFPGFITPVLTQLFFPKPPTTFLTCFSRGKRRNYAGKKVRLNRGSNSQSPGHESDTLTTEPPGRGNIDIMSCRRDMTKILFKVVLHILGRKFYKITKKSSSYSQSLLIFIHRTPVVERHLLTRQFRDLLRPRSTPTGKTVYFYMTSSYIYTLKIHRRSFRHSVR